ncbi:MAG TPA: CoA transferase [Hyphomicrobiaceae bacterium]|jgi:crotonobetainyl-CoA:carnitine CoA-transferase CaiB-like acyl-CoA transferase|nr:CoA transferase [Hyphomicrobiaceae bacterium]
MIPLLKGLRVLDLTSVILGPYATQILGDLGAEVIKIEAPEGDSMRPVSPTALPGLSAIFANCNRNKRSVVLDLKSEDGRAALKKLLPGADVFVHNMRQEAMDKLGFTFKAVREINPRIVYAAAVGFGRHGRYAGKPAYDDVIQAASGFAGLFQMRDGAPVYAPSIAADKVSGLHLTYAVLAALLHRERTGQPPGYVEVPMFELMAAFSLCEHLGPATFDEDGKVGYARVLSTGRRPYKTKDGWIGVLPYTQRNWTKVLTEIGRTEVIEAEWFTNATERSRRIDDLYDMLAAALPARSTADWLATFERLDIPCQPVRTPADLMNDPHLEDVGFFTPGFASETPVVRTLRQAVNVEGVRVEPDLAPPLLGADTASVLGEAGVGATASVKS